VKSLAHSASAATHLCETSSSHYENLVSLSVKASDQYGTLVQSTQQAAKMLESLIRMAEEAREDMKAIQETPSSLMDMASCCTRVVLEVHEQACLAAECCETALRETGDAGKDREAIVCQAVQVHLKSPNDKPLLTLVQSEDIGGSTRTELSCLSSELLMLSSMPFSRKKTPCYSAKSISDDLRLYEQGELSWWEVRGDADEILAQSELCSYWAEEEAELSYLGRLGCLFQSKKLLVKYYLMLLAKELMCTKAGMFTRAEGNFAMTFIECLSVTGLLIYGIQLLPRGRYRAIDSLQKCIEQFFVYFKLDRLSKIFNFLSTPSATQPTDLFEDRGDEAETKPKDKGNASMTGVNVMSTNQPFGVITAPGATQGTPATPGGATQGTPATPGGATQGTPATPGGATQGTPVTPRGATQDISATPCTYENEATRSSSSNLMNSSSDERTGGSRKKCVGFQDEVGKVRPAVERDERTSDGGLFPGQLMKRTEGTCSHGVPVVSSKTGTKAPVRISSLSKINRPQ